MMLTSRSLSRRVTFLSHQNRATPPFHRRITCHSSGGPDANKEVVSKPSTSSSDSEPVWVRRERERKLLAEDPKNGGLPWGLYLLFSSFVAIAAVGCIFEYLDKNPFFGIVQPDSPLWAPILITLAVTGFPTSAFLFYKGVDGFNEEADRQNKIDGY